MILTMLASDRSTVTPLSPPPHQGANSTHPSPSARQFRLPFNGLAQSELRRIFCSDEGACLSPKSAFFYARDHPVLSSMGGGSVCPRLFAPADDRNAPATPSAGGAIQSQPARSIGLVSPEGCNGAPLSETKVKADLAARFSTRALANPSPSSRKRTSVSICRELRPSDQTIKSEHVGTD